MSNIFTQRHIQLFLLSILILTIPYNISKHFIMYLTLIVFLSILIKKSFSFKVLLHEKSFLYLLFFIFMLNISFIWSESDVIFGGNYKVNLYAFLNYLFIIPAIYFSRLSKKDLHFLFYCIIFAPIFYVITYYRNYFYSSNIYSITHGGTFKLLFVDLQANLFILISTIFLYILFLNALINKNYKKSILSLLIFLLFCISLFIDTRTNTRLISITLILTICSSTIFILPKKSKYITSVLILIFSTFFILSSETFKTGFKELKTAYIEKEFIGSWGHRLNLVTYGFAMYCENPIIGRGTGDIPQKMREIQKNNSDDLKYPIIHFHNNHLLLLVQVGLIGYFIFSLFVYYYYKIKIKDPDIFYLKQSVILVFFIVMFGEHYFQWVNVSTFFAILYGMFLLYKNKEKATT